MSDPGINSIRSISIDRIEVANPRTRNPRIFREMVDNIGRVGLKKPITVTLISPAPDERFRLICGQGRLEAYVMLKQTRIPAVVLDADPANAMVMSLVENVARRKPPVWEHVQEIQALIQRGYSAVEIALKTGLEVEHVEGLRMLIDQGEQHLIVSVEAGTMPLGVALEIAKVNDAGARGVLRQAYETGALRGRKLAIVKRVIDRRRRTGKKVHSGQDQTVEGSVKAMVKEYQDDAARKKAFVDLAVGVNEQMSVITEALFTLLQSPDLVLLLKNNSLLEMPAQLAQRLIEKGVDISAAS